MPEIMCHTTGTAVADCYTPFIWHSHWYHYHIPQSLWDTTGKWINV